MTDPGDAASARVVLVCIAVLSLLWTVDADAQVAPDSPDCPPPGQVPDVRSHDWDVARDLLERCGFDVDPVRRDSPARDGTVIDQRTVDDETRRAVRLTAVVPSEPLTGTMPRVIGLQGSRARALLEGLGIEPRFQGVPSSAPEGEVVDQRPFPGEMVPADRIVGLNVSGRDAAAASARGVAAAPAVAAEGPAPDAPGPAQVAGRVPGAVGPGAAGPAGPPAAVPPADPAAVDPVGPDPSPADPAAADPTPAVSAAAPVVRAPQPSTPRLEETERPRSPWVATLVGLDALAVAGTGGRAMKRRLWPRVDVRAAPGNESASATVRVTNDG